MFKAWSSQKTFTHNILNPFLKKKTFEKQKQCICVRIFLFPRPGGPTYQISFPHVDHPKFDHSINGVVVWLSVFSGQAIIGKLRKGTVVCLILNKSIFENKSILKENTLKITRFLTKQFWKKRSKSILKKKTVWKSNVYVSGELFPPTRWSHLSNVLPTCRNSTPHMVADSDLARGVAALLSPY